MQFTADVDSLLSKGPCFLCHTNASLVETSSRLVRFLICQEYFFLAYVSKRGGERLLLIRGVGITVIAHVER